MISRLLLPYLSACIIAGVIGAGVHSYFATKRYAKLETRFLTYQVNAAEALAEAVENAQAEQRKQYQAAKDIENAALKKASEDAKVIADLHARYDRLRLKKPSCPPASGVPETNDSRIGTGATSGGEFLEADGRSLIRIAEDAERIRGRLTACQALLRTLL